MHEPRTRTYDDLNPVDAFPGGVRHTLVELTLTSAGDVPKHTRPHTQAQS